MKKNITEVDQLVLELKSKTVAYKLKLSIWNDLLYLIIWAGSDRFLPYSNSFLPTEYQ